MKKVLIIGANGFTGRRILNDLCKDKCYELSGCSLHDDIAPAKGYRFYQIDVCNSLQLENLFKEVKPNVVINTSALSVPDYCETHHKEADAVNVDAVRSMALLCTRYKSRFIHFSTDFVFDGNSKQLYAETDATNPVNYYGISKVAGERIVASVCNDYAIVRVVVVYGKALPGQHGNILQLVANKLRNGEPIKVVSDQWRTPTYVGDISKAIATLIKTNQNGIYHICGRDCLSIAEIAYRVAAVLRLDSTLIHPVTTIEMQERTPRPAFSGLCIEKAMNELDYHPLSLDEGILASHL